MELTKTHSEDKEIDHQDFFLQYKNTIISKISNAIWIEPNKVYRVTSVNELTMVRIERKLDELRCDVATKEDIINQTKILLSDQERRSVELQKKLDILRSMQEANVPYKRLAKYSTAFFLFFALSFLANIILRVTIITPLWNNIGLLFSFGFLVIAFAMSIDWKEKTKKG